MTRRLHQKTKGGNNKSMKKKFIALLTALILVVSAAGCGNSAQPTAPEENKTESEKEETETAETETADTDSQSGTERTEVTMWFWGAAPWQQEILQKNLIDVFNSSQNEYELVVEFRSSVDDDISVALSAGEGPDIVYGSGPAFVTPYAEAGKLASLDEYAGQYGWEDLLQTPLYNTCKVDDSLYAVPIAMFCSGLFYNKEVLDEHNWQVPGSIDELTAICDEALEADLYPILYGVKGWLPALEEVPSLFFTQWAGPSAVYECLTNQQKWNNPKMVEAVNATNEWYQKKYLCSDLFDLSSSEAMQLFVDGGAPFLFGSSSGYQRLAGFIENDEQAAKFGFIPFPSGREGVPDPVYTLAINATLSINAASENKDAAAAVLNIIESQDFMEKMTAQWPGYWMTALKDYSTVNTDGMGELGKQCVEVMRGVCDAAAESKFGFYSSTFYPAATASVMQNIDTVWYGTSTAEELLDKMDAEFAKEYANGSVPELVQPAE